jgi:hypothetical protein
METHLLIPLPLAELLHVALGTLAMQLEEEDHEWTGLAKALLEAYRSGRDDQLYERYGERAVADVNLVTAQVAETVANWVSEQADQQEHFEEWAKEFDERKE